MSIETLVHCCFVVSIAQTHATGGNLLQYWRSWDKPAALVGFFGSDFHVCMKFELIKILQLADAVSVLYTMWKRAHTYKRAEVSYL